MSRSSSSGVKSFGGLPTLGKGQELMFYLRIVSVCRIIGSKVGRNVGSILVGFQNGLETHVESDLTFLS